MVAPATSLAIRVISIRAYGRTSGRLSASRQAAAADSPMVRTMPIATSRDAASAAAAKPSRSAAARRGPRAAIQRSVTCPNSTAEHPAMQGHEVSRGHLGRVRRDDRDVDAGRQELSAQRAQRQRRRA